MTCRRESENTTKVFLYLGKQTFIGNQDTTLKIIVSLGGSRAQNCSFQFRVAQYQRGCQATHQHGGYSGCLLPLLSPFSPSKYSVFLFQLHYSLFTRVLNFQNICFCVGNKQLGLNLLPKWSIWLLDACNFPLTYTCTFYPLPVHLSPP